QREADRAVGLHFRVAEDARQFHHQRGAGAIVVGGFAETDAVHVRADDVHLFRMGRADLGAVDVLAQRGAHRRLLGVERADAFVGLQHRVTVHAGGNAVAEQRAAALAGRAATAAAAALLHAVRDRG